MLSSNKIHVVDYRKSKRFGIDVPVYSLQAPSAGRPDLHSLLSGVTSERFVEYDFASRNLPAKEKHARILDIGTGTSGLAIALDTFSGGNWQVIGIDIDRDRDCDAMMDARQMAFRDTAFDNILCISTLEHIGLCDEKIGADGDVQALQEISRVLKDDGTLVITIPFGPAHKSAGIKGGNVRAEIHDMPTMRTRIYDDTTLENLVAGFSIASREFYRYRVGKWELCSQLAAGRLEAKSGRNGIQLPIGFHSSACACLLLRKQERRR